jgi:hypothetical protein
MNRYRTTFTPDERVAMVVRETALLEKRSMSDVLNSILEGALFPSDLKTEGATPFAVEACDLGLKPGLDPARLRDVLADLEIEDR